MGNDCLARGWPERASIIMCASVIEKSSALLLFNTKRNLSGPPSMRHVKSLDFINITDNRTGLHSSQASSVSISLFVAGKA